MLKIFYAAIIFKKMFYVIENPFLRRIRSVVKIRNAKNRIEKNYNVNDAVTEIEKVLTM